MEGAGAVSYLAQVGSKVPAQDSTLFSGNAKGIDLEATLGWPLPSLQLLLAGCTGKTEEEEG